MLAQILVVEDDPHLGPLLKEYLSADYQVHHASTLKDAQAWLGTHSAQLILLDLNLPDGDGLDLVQSLR
ncbi:response regulator, partial [Micrococcus sp. SIMBA_131]